MHVIAEYAKINRPERMLKHPPALTTYLAFKEQGIMADSQLTFASEDSQSATPVEYRDIKGFPGYRVGSDGSVWSCKSINGKGPLSSEWKKLKPIKKANGYIVASLCCGKIKSLGVHCLVAQAFIGERPDGMYVYHCDGNPQNNRVSNLRYGTPKSNSLDRWAHGTMPAGSQHHNATLTEEQVVRIRRLFRSGIRRKDIASEMGVDRGTVNRVIRGHTYSATIEIEADESERIQVRMES